MGRRNKGGGLLKETLSVRVESCKSKFSTVDEIVNHLRSTYPDYQRTKLQTLIRCVHETLQSTVRKPNNTHKRDDNDGGSYQKKRKKIDEGEERLQNRRSNETPSTSSDLFPEEAVYGEKAETDDDLRTTTWRNPCAGNHVELDVTNSSKAASSVDNGGGGGDEGETMVTGKEGPRFSDFGGMKGILEELNMEVIVPLLHPQLSRHLGVRPMSGILLHGPPGCGKTSLALAIANETDLPFYQISATEVVSGVSGASEENIRELFSKACRTAPSIIFIDEIDAIASKRENLQREMEKRIVTQLMTCMDQSKKLLQPADGSDVPPGCVLVIGATNRPDTLDPALRRSGRFDREIMVGIPDESAREEILSVFTRNLRLEGSFDLQKIARSTPGFVGADLETLANKAGNLAMKRIIDERKRGLSQNLMGEHTKDWRRVPWLPEEMDKLAIKMSDFEEAVKMVQPSLRREGFSSIPNVKWGDVGGLDLLRQEFIRHIVRPIKNPERYERLGVDLERGFLLYGPPGCGKTLIAKAVANEAGANFIHIKGPELLNKYVGESEAAVRSLFSRARTCAPCIVFFDEVDALTTERGMEGGLVTGRVLLQLLSELNGAESRKGVFVIGATNRPGAMDSAVLRSGRFDKHFYVTVPSPDERVSILKALARKKCVDASVDLEAIGRSEACENLSGADLAALMNEAAMAALEEDSTSTETNSGTLTIKSIHFEVAMGKVTPTVSDKQKRHYLDWSKRFSLPLKSKIRRAKKRTTNDGIRRDSDKFPRLGHFESGKINTFLHR